MRPPRHSVGVRVSKWTTAQVYCVTLVSDLPVGVVHITLLVPSCGCIEEDLDTDSILRDQGKFKLKYASIELRIDHNRHIPLIAVPWATTHTT